MSPLHSVWQSDWVYALVLRQADVYFAHCNRDSDQHKWKYVLIEEYAQVRGTTCQGDPVRAWVRDEDGLREIPLEEHSRLTFELERSRASPFIQLMYHILPDHRRVVFGWVLPFKCGCGWQYLVHGEGEDATLRSDPSAGWWES